MSKTIDSRDATCGIKPSPPLDRAVVIKAKCGCGVLVCVGRACWVSGCEAERELYQDNVKAGEYLRQTVHDVELDAHTFGLDNEEAMACHVGLIACAHRAYVACLEAHRAHLMSAITDIITMCEYNLFGINVCYPHGGIYVETH